MSFLAAKVKKETQMATQLFTKYKYPQLKRKKADNLFTIHSFLILSPILLWANMVTPKLVLVWGSEVQ